jgi:LEA14-like dessication related protein
MRKVAIGLAAVALAASAACASMGLGGFKDPIVSFRDLKVNGIGLNGGALDVVLGVYNPNGFNLDASRITYQLYVDTIPFGNGAIDTRKTLTKNDTTLVTLPLNFTWTGMNRAVQAAMNTGTVPYRVTGDITVGSGVGNFTVKYDQTGRFNTLTGASR